MLRVSALHVFYCILLCFLLTCTQCEVIHHRPPNGVGPLLISGDSSQNSYNTERLMVFFDLSCLSDSKPPRKSKPSSTNVMDVQESYLNSIISKFNSKSPSCLSHTNGDDRKHFQFSSHNSAISFLDIKQQQSNDDGNDNGNDNDNENSCLNTYKNEILFNYSEHCLDIVTYEPMYKLHSFENNDYSPLTTEAELACTTAPTPTPTKYGLDAADSDVLDTLYTYPNRSIDNGVDLYILDSGVLSTHEEFFDGQVIHELGDGPTEYEPENWIGSHGTHVASIAGGLEYGHSKYLTIYDYRVCEYYGVPSSESSIPCFANKVMIALDDILNKLKDGTTTRRGVINLSLGGTKDMVDYIYEYYFEELIKYGGIAVTSAGNSHVDACDYAPAFSTKAITVGSYDSSYTPSSFSNWGDCVDVFHPGSSIYAACTDSDTYYCYKSGTSMSSPSIAGTIANLLYVDPTLSFNEIKALLKINTRTITGDKCDEYDCISPIYECSVLPREYFTNGSYPETTTGSGDYVAFDGFPDSDCNYFAYARINRDESDTDNYNNYYIQKTEYQATDKCLSLQYDSDRSHSYSIECVSDTTAELVVWDDDNCGEIDGTEGTIVKTIESGMIDGDDWFYVDCDNEYLRNNELINDYDSSDCDLVYRIWYADGYYTDGGEDICIYNETESFYIDYSTIIGACNVLSNTTTGKISSWEFDCDDETIYVTYYDNDNCDISGLNASGIYGSDGCYTDANASIYVRLQMLECGSDIFDDYGDTDDTILDDIVEWIAETAGVSKFLAYVIIAAAVLVFLAICVCSICCCCRKKSKKHNYSSTQLAVHNHSR